MCLCYSYCAISEKHDIVKNTEGFVIFVQGGWKERERERGIQCGAQLCTSSFRKRRLKKFCFFSAVTSAEHITAERGAGDSGLGRDVSDRDQESARRRGEELRSHYRTSVRDGEKRGNEERRETEWGERRERERREMR